MTDALTVSDLRDLRLTSKEWTALWNLGSQQCCPARAGASDEATDALVLAGLIERERNETDTGWVESWVMTPAGLEANVLVDNTFDWNKFVHVEAPAPARERIKLGSLVKHKRTGAIGLVTEHTMWDGNWGAFRVDVAGAHARLSKSTHIDRADKWELVS